jgi:hypothetical protein
MGRSDHTRCGPPAQPQVVESRVAKRGRTRRIARRVIGRTGTRAIAVVRRWGTPFRAGGKPCAGAGYQSGESGGPSRTCNGRRVTSRGSTSHMRAGRQ